MKTNGDMTLVCQNTKVLWRSNTEGANVDKGLEFQVRTSNLINFINLSHV